MKNCVDIVVPFVQELERENITNVQIMGGIGSVVLTRPDFLVLPDEYTILPRDEIELSQYRDNGTKRDVDVLVLSSDKDEVDAVEKIAQEIIGEELEISIFGLKNAWDLAHQRKHPIKSSAKVFLADRYVGLHGVGDSYKALFPFVVPLNPEILETWYIPIGQGDTSTAIPIPNPGATILNYATRSVSGIRPKDLVKLEQIVQSVSNNYPDLHDWIIDGPGKDQLYLAQILHALRQPQGTTEQEAFRLGEVISAPLLDLEAVVTDQQYSMINHLPRGAQKAILSITRLKSQILHWGESKEHIVKVFQNMFEQKLDFIVKNK